MDLIKMQQTPDSIARSVVSFSMSFPHSKTLVQQHNTNDQNSAYSPLGITHQLVY